MYIKKIINEEINRIKINDIINNNKVLGTGDNGIAYLLESGNVMKLTRSGVEANLMKRLLNKTPDHITHIFSWNEIDIDGYKYAYEREYVDINWTEMEELAFDEVISEIDRNNWNEFKNLNYIDKIKIIKRKILETIGDGDFDYDNNIYVKYNFNEITNERILYIMTGIESVERDLRKYGIERKWLEYTLNNYGVKRNGNFATFDIGYY